MFGNPKAVLFEPYGKRRSRWPVPRWFVLLLIGMALGAGGVVFVQERYQPPRLSAGDSVKLQKAFDQAEAERLRLAGQIEGSTKQRETALAEIKGLTDQLAASREASERLRENLASIVASLPPDPRGGTIAVRAARFTVADQALAYDVVLSRERAGGKPLSGVMQFVVSGESARGSETALSLKPVPISVGSFESLRGKLPLPEGFKPRQTTINVLDRVEGKLLGMRVINIR